jgi:hypothetical protein
MKKLIFCILKVTEDFGSDPEHCFTVLISVPKRTVRKRARPTWMTQQILAAIRRKPRLCAKAKKRRDVEEYVACEREVKRMIRNAKRSFEKRLAEKKVETVAHSTHTSSRGLRASPA